MDTTINEYLDYLQSQDKSTATLRATRSDLSGFQQWWEQTTNRSFQVTHLGVPLTTVSYQTTL